MTDAGGVADLNKLSVSRNVLFGFLGWVTPLGATFALTPYIVHGLGSESYGLYALILGMVGTLAALNFNAGRAITKYVSAFQVYNQTDKISQVLSSTLGLYLLIGLMNLGGTLLLADWLVGPILHISPALQPVARQALYWAVLSLLFTLIAQVFGAIPQALQRFDLYGAITTAGGVATVGGNALMVWLQLDVTALIAWVALMNGLTGIAFVLVTARLLPGLRITGHVHKPLLLELFKFGGAVTAYQLFGNLLVLFERSWLTRTLGSAAVTYFVVPMTIAIYIHSFVFSLTLVFFPLVSEADARRDTARLLQIYTRACKYIGLLVIFLVITFVVGGSQALSMWMGESFAAQASGVLQVQAVSFGLVAMVVIPWQMADGLGFPHWNALLALLWLVVAVLLSIILTPAWRIMAPAWARLVAVLTAPAFVLLVERRVFGQCLMNFWKQAGSSLTMAGGVTVLIQSMIINTHILTGWMTLLASTAVSGLVYMVTLWLIGYFDQIERTYLKNLLGRTISPLAAILAR